MSDLKRFEVTVREVHVQTYEVYAEDKQDAIASVDVFRYDEGVVKFIEGSFAFSHLLESDTWTVEQVADTKEEE